MEKLAYSDSLTGLSNRAAFHEKEDEIRLKKTECIIVQLDINFLKKVNDVYGHAEGDRHIISDCFKELGTSYHTGSDEFIVITHKREVSDVETALEKPEERVKNYNAENAPPIPMQIAYGYSKYDQNIGSASVFVFSVLMSDMLQCSPVNAI